MSPIAVFIQRKMPVWKKKKSIQWPFCPLFSQIGDQTNLFHLKWPSKSLTASQIENSSCIVFKVLCWSYIDMNTILNIWHKSEASSGYFIYSVQLDTLGCLLNLWLKDNTHPVNQWCPLKFQLSVVQTYFPHTLNIWQYWTFYLNVFICQRHCEHLLYARHYTRHFK